MAMLEVGTVAVDHRQGQVINLGGGLSVDLASWPFLFFMWSHAIVFLVEKLRSKRTKSSRGEHVGNILVFSQESLRACSPALSG